MAKGIIGKRLRKESCVLLMIVVMICMKGRVRAEGFYENSFINYSPDGRAWTVQEALPRKEDAYNKTNPACWYPFGEVYETGNPLAVLEPECGEHLYHYERHGIVPIHKWMVAHHAGKCIHNDATYFHGIYPIESHCGCSYYSGWNGYCADCGEKVMNFYLYMSRDKISRITEVDTDLGYYYLCPTCGHMEQGVEMRHVCKAVSANRYRVRYLANGGNVAGFMQSSFHMYGNADRFEGEVVTPVKTLNKNTYSRPGYIFAGWNRMPDGSGEAYEDGQEIYNLTDENYDSLENKGTVLLYAQWKKVTGCLEIDPDGGTYQGQKGIVSEEVGYEEVYKLKSEAVRAPEGFLIRFEVNGGQPLEDIRDTRMLAGWNLQMPAKGTLDQESYRFLGADGERDRVKVLYRSEGIRLPSPIRSGYGFGGWYDDATLTRRIGSAGDLYMPERDVTLYACWVDLVLEAKVNLRDHGGKGAVDLRWSQQDGNRKIYLLYQKKESEGFQKIYDALEEENNPRREELEGRAQRNTIMVRRTGFYKITAKGSQGQDYEEYKGGLGGSVEGTFFLKAGDEVEIVFDDGERENGGDSVKYGKGGGSVSVISKEGGLLLVAGGGGGAMPEANGGDGGAEDGLREDGRSEGEDGAAGGGAGGIGGKAGIYEKHIHSLECRHVHSGDEINGGDCYEEIVETKTCHVVVNGPFVDWGKSDNCDDCIRAGRGGYGTMHPRVWRIEHHGCGQPHDNGSAGWWVCERCGKIGFRWGSGTQRPGVSDHTWTNRSFVLNCTKEFDCGNPPGKMIRSHGGSNYVNESLAVSRHSLRGVNEGNGKVIVEALNVGFLEKTELAGAYAPDQACPERVDEDSVTVEAAGENMIRVAFAEPEDRGTIYYHQVHSYLAGNEEILSSSNVTMTEVLTGIAGYYYLIDREKDTRIEIKEGNTKATFIAGREIFLTLPEKEAYLHLAALDKAGNLGESIAVKLQDFYRKIAWFPFTEKLMISSDIAGRDYGSVAVFEKAKDYYYVRADGRTPFLLGFVGSLFGEAREDYQVDRLTYEFALQGDAAKGSHTCIVPRGSTGGQNYVWDGGQLGRITVGNGLLQAGMYGMAERVESGKTVITKQSFCMDAAYDGKVIKVMPIAGSTMDDRVVLSDRQRDEGNAIWLIGDGEAPGILGIPTAEEILLADREEDVLVELWAEDLGSGVFKFEAELRNLDNGNQAFYHADANGHIEIRLEAGNPLFEGDLQLWLRAVDRVGNVAELKCGAEDFGLCAEIVRVLVPHDPIFKRGESGILRIKARGYVRKLEVAFPNEFVDWNPGLNCTIDYADPQANIVEELLFMVPLTAVEDREYEVIVKAYKGDNMVEDKPELCTLKVNDTVLREIRTRLR